MVGLIREDELIYRTELLDLRNDFVFKSFFMRANHLLVDFLNSILDLNIIRADIINSELEIMHADDKFSMMDLKVETENGERINIEMQLQSHEAFPERMLMYWAKMYATQDNKGKSYKELKKSIQIIVTNFKLLPKSNYYSKFQVIDSEDGTVFSEHLELYVLELPKLHVSQLKQINQLEKWLLFLKADKKMKEALAMESSVMKDAWDEIERLSQDPKTVEIALSREFFLRDQLQREEDALNRGIEKGMEKGIEKGIEKIMEKVVLRSHALGMNTDVIMELTHLSAEEVHKIIERNNR